MGTIWRHLSKPPQKCWEDWDPVNRFYHSRWVAIVTPTDRPKSTRNRFVIEVFGGVCVLSRCILGFSVGVGDFVIGLSQISSFFSEYQYSIIDRLWQFYFTSNVISKGLLLLYFILRVTRRFSIRDGQWNVWIVLVCRGPWMSTVVLYCWCHSDSASVLLYFTLWKFYGRYEMSFKKTK